MVNVGTGNLIVQSDDMAVPHKGVALAFRRTYNSQSGHDIVGTDGTPPGLYGNGWTNTFDAHLMQDNVNHVVSIYDIDGARYDYQLNAAGNGWIPPPGQHATLTFDGGCGYDWQKKNGSTYVFYLSDLTYPTCNRADLAGYDGRLFQIQGRNQNTNITFTYSWDNGNGGAGGKISQIVATTESGLRSTLAFADMAGVNGTQFRALQTLTAPDNTAVSYQYGPYGTLRYVTLPPNNSAGVPAVKAYGAGFFPNGGSTTIPLMNYYASPRWNSSHASDGARLAIAYQFTGADNAHAQLSQIDSIGFMDGVPPDGTNTPLQPYPANGSGNASAPYLSEVFTPGILGQASTAQVSDSDGHSVSVSTDSSGRPLQDSISVPGAHCQGTSTSQALCTSQRWDQFNNLIASIDERGNETDYAYDANGNAIAVAAPADQNGIRGTRLASYDASSNLVAACDAVATNSAGANWAPPQTPRDCATGVAAHATFSYTATSAEPMGELTSVITAGGRINRVAYDPGAQGGADFGLPTGVSSDAIAQADGTTRTPAVWLRYDSHGNAICSSSGTTTATTIRVFDSMNRLKAVSDPDDASVPAAGCSKVAGIAQSSIVTGMTYFPDGSLATLQTPSEAAAGVSTQFTYSPDGNLETETAHHANTLSTTRYWYDGADRLAEVGYPQNPSGDIPWYERYIYDLSKNAGTQTLSGLNVTGHGSLVEVEKSSPSGWIDIALTNYDAAGRANSRYSFAPCAAGSTAGAVYCNNAPQRTSYVWDQNAATDGILTTIIDPLQKQRLYNVDRLGRIVGRNLSGPNVSAISTTYTFDLAGRLTSATDGNGAASTKFAYNVDGLMTSEQGPGSSPDTTTYEYYPDSSLKDVQVATQYFSQTNLSQYSYRGDGKLVSQSVPLTGERITYDYTNGGRINSRTLLSAQSASYGADSWVYDGAGRPRTYQIPAGTYSNLTYDAEGDLLSFTGYGGEAVSNGYDVRGDLIGQVFTPNPTTNGFTAWPAFQYSNVQGVTVQSSTEQWDGRTGAMLSDGNKTLTYDALGRLSSVSGVPPSGFTYDAADRLIGGDSESISTKGQCGTADTKRYTQGGAQRPSTTYSYGPDDAVAQTVTGTQFTTQTTRNWHWSSGSLLYTETGGVASPINIDDIGVVPADGRSPGLTVSDLDANGLPASAHNATGSGTWIAPNPFQQKCVEPQPVAASAGYVDVGATVVTAVPGQTDDGINIMRTPLSVGGSSLSPAGSAQSSSRIRRPSNYCYRDENGDLVLIKDPTYGHTDVCVDTTPPLPPQAVGDQGSYGPASGFGYGGTVGPPPPRTRPQPRPRPRPLPPPTVYKAPPPQCIPYEWSTTGSYPATDTTAVHMFGEAVGATVGFIGAAKVAGSMGGGEITQGTVGTIAGPGTVSRFPGPGAYYGGKLGDVLYKWEYPDQKPTMLFFMTVCPPG